MFTQFLVLRLFVFFFCLLDGSSSNETEVFNAHLGFPSAFACTGTESQLCDGSSCCQDLYSHSLCNSRAGRCLSHLTVYGCNVRICQNCLFVLFVLFSVLVLCCLLLGCCFFVLLCFVYMLLYMCFIGVFIYLFVWCL